VVRQRKYKKARLLRHKYPFILVLMRSSNEKGELLLIVMNQEWHQLSLKGIYEVFDERGDIEHFLRFAR